MTWSVGRLSSLQSNLFSRAFVEKTQVDLQRAGQEVSTGRHADIYAQLGVRSASLLTLRTQEDATQAYIKADDVLGNKLQAMMTSVDAVRKSVQSVLETALSSASNPANGASTLQSQARAALESVVAILNTSFNGSHLFSGLASNHLTLTRWDDQNPGTGLSPKDVLQGIVGSGPASAAQAQSMTDEIDKIFASTDTTNPLRNFESTFYNGTPALNASGQPANRLTGMISPGQVMSYGVQANDGAFRDILKGLSMLATVDVSKIGDKATYSKWMGNVINTLSAGQEGALNASAQIGFNQQILETTSIRLHDRSMVQRTQIANFENVDLYEATTRMKNLQNQLEASYTVAARLSNLSILKYL